MKQLTVKNTVVISGPGLHKGKKNKIIISAAQADVGLKIINAGCEYVVSPNLVADTKRGTSLRYKKSVLHTIEHMVSALRGLGIDNALISVEGDEPPAVDGSSYPYVLALKKAGLIQLTKEKKFINIKTPMLVEDGGKYLAVLPYKGLKVSYFSDFSGYGIAPAEVSVQITPKVYEKMVSKARTFGFKSEIGWLIKAGLIKGASLENAILIDKGLPVKGSLRYPDELTRHKVLDIVGDFGMLGANLNMHIIAYKTGHKHNVEMAKKIQDSFLSKF